MKIIDEKGRFFGKVSIIDMMLLFAFLSVLLPFCYFSWKIFHTPPPVRVKETEIFCKFNNIAPDLLDTIKVGDAEMSNGETDAEIKEILLVEPFYYTVQDGDGKLITKKHPQNKQMWVKLKIKVQLKYGEMFYHNELIYPTAPLIFRTGNYALQGFVQENAPSLLTGVEQASDAEEPGKIPIDFLITFFNVGPSILDEINVGDFQLDKKGEIVASIATINWKATQMNSEEYRWDKRFKEGYTVSALLTLRCSIVNNLIYFNNKEIRRGQPFIFKTKDYTLTGIVTDSPFGK